VGSHLGICPATLLTDFTTTDGDDIRAALDAARAAGAAGVSVWTPHLDLLGGASRAARWCAESGIRVVAVEAAVAWPSGEPAAVAEEAKALAAAVAAVGASRVVAVTMAPAVTDLDRARAGLGVLVEHLEAAGAHACVEFLPWSGIPDLATAWALVEPLGAAAGVLIDAWHWQRQPGGPNPELLSRIPGERIGYVQMCDAAPGDGRELAEAMTGRLLPGDGVVNFDGLFEVLARIDAQPFIATEVFNPALVAELGRDAFAAASITAAEKVIGARA